MNENKIKFLIAQIKENIPNKDIILKYGPCESVRLSKGEFPMISDAGWLCVVKNRNRVICYVDLDSVYELILD